MSLIISLGSNLQGSLANIKNAKNLLSKKFILTHESRVYKSKAVDYEDQPDFLNQVLEFELPEKIPTKVMDEILELEVELGRIRTIDKGPRIIDIDIIFWGIESFKLPNLVVPHPRCFDRSFIILPFLELPFSKILEKHMDIPRKFQNSAVPLALTD